MRKLKQTLRMIGLVLFIILAVCGIGIIGGAPVPPPRKKEDTIELKTELVENKEKKTDVLLFEVKE